jgi:hypothetical protein
VTPPPTVAPTVTITIKGKTYVVTDTGERGEYEHDKVVTAPGEAPCPDDGETFCGTQRRAAKISIAPNTTMEPFDDVGGLLPTLVPDPTMRAKNISRGAGSNRVPEENRNVHVKKAWIYAFKKEDDNDYHLIVGTDPQHSPRQFMNMEASGLPPAPGMVRNTLKAVRTTFEEIMHNYHYINQSYKRFDPPVPVEIQGSIFFDVSHIPPDVGPPGMKPPSAWEVHPVTKLTLRD